MRMVLSAVMTLGLVALAVLEPLHAGGVRQGMIIELRPIENRGDDESEGVKQRRTWGRMLGKVASAGAMVLAGRADGAVSDAATYAAGSGAVEAGTEEAVAKIGGPGPTTRYMVKVRLDSGKVLAITQVRQQLDGVKVGSRVTVDGSGDGAKISLE